MPQTWDAQIKAGLIDENSGIRFCESIDIDPQLKFNALAQKGGALDELLQHSAMPFYVDRLQGGCFIEKYPYDPALLAHYQERLGDRFWGFQMHEWMSNISSDIAKITRNHCQAWTEEAITAAIFREFHYEHIFLEAMDAGEFAALGHAPTDIGEFLEASRWLFRDRQAYTQGLLLPCDSFCQANALELNLGARRLMPELGAQTADARIQMAYARGMASARGLPFGAYYEPWGGNPFSACSYHREGLNEWGETGDSFPFAAMGGSGGSSRSLQKRIHLFSYMAGASFMAEEWGMCNTFYDWQDFELSPYGQVKLNFLKFTRKYADIGQPVIPMAVVLPKEMEVLESLQASRDKYLGFPVSGDFAQKLRAVRAGLTALFRDAEPLAGSEPMTLSHAAVPDALDIVRADFLPQGKYQYLVDLTGDPAFAKAHPNACSAEEAPALLQKALPCQITPGLHTQLTRTADGGYYLIVLNNAGISRSVAGGEQILPDQERSISVTPKDHRSLLQLEGDGSVSSENGIFRITVPAGGFFFGRF